MEKLTAREVAPEMAGVTAWEDISDMLDTMPVIITGNPAFNGFVSDAAAGLWQLYNGNWKEDKTFCKNDSHLYAFSGYKKVPEYKKFEW